MEKLGVPKKEIWFFGFGMFGQGFVSGFMGYFLFLFYNHIGIKPLVVGVILGIARVWDGMNDPIIGAILDRRKPGKNGKFRPLILKTAIPIGIITILLFYIPLNSSVYVQCVWILVLYLGWDVLFTIHDISKWSLAARISPLEKDRSKIITYSKILLEVGFVVPHMLVLLVDENNMKSLSALTGLNFTFENVIKTSVVILGIAGGLIMGVSYLAKERVEVYNTPQPIIRDIRIIFKNKTLMLLLLSTLLGSLAINIGSDYYFFATMNVGYNIFGTELKGANALTLYGIITVIPGIIFSPLVNKVSAKIGKKNIFILSLISTCIFNITAYVVGYEGRMFLISSILMVISNIPRSWQTIAYVSLVTESIDYLEWKTGRRTEGITYALNSLTSKIGVGISTIIAGLTLTLLKFDPAPVNGAVVASALFKKWVWPVIVLKPVFSVMLSIIPILFIDYTGKKKESIQSELLERRALLAEKYAEN